MLIVVASLQVLMCAFLIKTLETKELRLTLLLFNIALFMYSCFGIAQYDIDTKYYWTYLLCMFTFNIFYRLGISFCNFVHAKKNISGVTYGSTVDYQVQTHISYVKYIAYIYFFIRIVMLFYPEFYLKYLFLAPNFIYRNLLDALKDSTNTTLGHLLSTFSTITMPFAYLYLQKKGKKSIVCFFILDLIAQYLTGRGSIGRLAVIRNIIIICLVLYVSATTKKKRRQIVVWTCLISAFSIFIYVAMEFLRNGISLTSSGLGIVGIFNYFIDGEFFYPKHYPLAEQLSEANAYPSGSFWTWLFTLPIPKAIFNVASVDSYKSITYRVFSYYYWGGHWGYESGGYAGMLLSVVGDGILTYGPTFAFVIVIPFATFIGYFLQFVLKIKDSQLLFCATAFYFFVSFRPGVQYGLSYINTYVGILLISLMFALLSKPIRHRNINNDYKEE